MPLKKITKETIGLNNTGRGKREGVQVIKFKKEPK